MTLAQPLKHTHSGRTDADATTLKGTCPADMSAFQQQVGQVAADIKAGRVVRIYRERTRHGLAWVLPVEDPAATIGGTSKTIKAIAWMVENDQLARRPFFEACSWARNSASLHDRAVKRIAKAGHAEKIAGAWVLKDHSRALAWLRETEGPEGGRA